MTTDRRDLAIRAALTPAADVVVPMDLAESIHRELVATPQPRRLFGGRAWRALPDLSFVPAVARLALIAMLLLALALAVAIAARPHAGPVAVVGYHGDEARTGRMPGPGPSGTPTIAWTFALAGPMGSMSMPLIREGTVYVMDTRGTAVALAAGSGEELWRVGELGQGIGSPVLVGSDLILSSDDGTIIALDVATGHEVWRVSSGASTKAPVAALDDTIVQGGNDGMVRAFSAVDGHSLWSFDAGGPVERAPAIVDGVAYVAAVGARVTAYDLAARRILWATELGPGEVSTPVVDAGVVYLTHGPLDRSTVHDLVAIDTASGRTTHTWPSPSDDRVFVGAVVDGRVYTIGEDGAVRVVDTTLGDGVLEPLAQVKDPVDSLATLVGDTLYIGSTGGEIHAIDRLTGADLWSVAVQGSLTMPVVVDGQVFVGTSVGQLISLADPASP